MAEPYRHDTAVYFPPTSEEKNLKLLATFHYVVGALVALTSSVFIFHIAIGVKMLNGPTPMWPPFPMMTVNPLAPPPPNMGIFFVAIGCAAVLLGWTMGALTVLAGRFIALRRGHLFCLVVAGLSCMWMPFGTVLGVFTLVELTKPHVRAMFERRADPL
ncbi:MAG TPA: hypothetical protein VGM06_19920 [Polyangiaceae bacterium]|jgi:hypothetical protein